MRDFLVLCGIGWAIALSSIGCSNSEQSEPIKPAIRQLSTQKLPTLGDYMLPLDNGRIEIASPEGWHLPQRSKQYIVRFQQDPNPTSIYPSIMLTGSDAKGISNVTADNVQKYAAEIIANESVETAEPVQLDDRYYVIYRKRGKAPQSIDRILERLFFSTVVEGRQYRVELRTREDRLDESQPSLLAVVAGIRYLKNQPPSAEFTEKSPDNSTEEKLDINLQEDNTPIEP